jgi:hypothetical protein
MSARSVNCANGEAALAIDEFNQPVKRAALAVDPVGDRVVVPHRLLVVGWAQLNADSDIRQHYLKRFERCDLTVDPIHVAHRSQSFRIAALTIVKTRHAVYV